MNIYDEQQQAMWLLHVFINRLTEDMTYHSKEPNKQTGTAEDSSFYSHCSSSTEFLKLLKKKKPKNFNFHI